MLTCTEIQMIVRSDCNRSFVELLNRDRISGEQVPQRTWAHWHLFCRPAKQSDFDPILVLNTKTTLKEKAKGW